MRVSLRAWLDREGVVKVLCAAECGPVWRARMRPHHCCCMQTPAGPAREARVATPISVHAQAIAAGNGMRE